MNMNAVGYPDGIYRILSNLSNNFIFINTNIDTYKEAFKYDLYIPTEKFINTVPIYKIKGRKTI